MIYKKRQHKYSLRPRILGAIQKFQRPRKTLITARCQKKRSVPPRNNSTLRILRNAPLTDRARSAFSVSSACMHHAAARTCMHHAATRTCMHAPCSRWHHAREFFREPAFLPVSTRVFSFQFSHLHADPNLTRAIFSAFIYIR